MKMQWAMNFGALKKYNIKKINWFSNFSINAQLLILVGISSLVLVATAGFGYYSVYKESAHVVNTVDLGEENIKKIALSRAAAISFRKQIQEWQNILMRGDNEVDFKKYFAQFEVQEVEVQVNLMDLRASLSEKDQSTISFIESVVRKHAEQGVKYREALKSYDIKHSKESGIIVDSMVGDVDITTSKLMDDLTVSIERSTDEDLEKMRENAKQDLNKSSMIFVAVTIAALFLSFVLALPIRRGVDLSVKSINALRDEAEQQNQRNQKAILRLLDEVADLADGDLTRKPEVTEDVTGAIADSLGYAIETLRNLVGAINITAEKVSSGAASTKEATLRLTAESDRQAQEINTVGVAVSGMTKSIGQVSKNAVESSSVAKQSVNIAKRGAQTVQNTIESMETIREQIQETSKRIKRLGESSKEIGEIVALINDIADQTSILALNASIQAAMAGEAGRGFSVVADEVQRLSERVGNSTKQIESLVKAIQADTSEAVSSMEKSTTGVISGARLAQDAGKALAEIETVSVNLDKLIENISREAREQSDTAGTVSGLMGMIQDISTKTSLGTKKAAISIGELTGLAGELKKSVAGFKLPG